MIAEVTRQDLLDERVWLLLILIHAVIRAIALARLAS
jgi:hypothetical protein